KRCVRASACSGLRGRGGAAANSHNLGRSEERVVFRGGMRLLLLTLSVVSCGALLLGCPKKDGDADASADADVVEAEAPPAAVVEDAAPADEPAAPAVVNAKNSADVAR